VELGDLLQLNEEGIMNIVNWSPYREMDEIFNRYRRFGLSGDDRETQGTNLDWRPVADISETDSEYLIKAELPEIDRKDVRVVVENGCVTISGERKMDKEEEDATRHRVETFYGTFSRSFTLPSDVDEEKISAKSKNGMLKVHIPKTKVTRPKSIEIAVN
jgi:HSP20 family protein